MYKKSLHLFLLTAFVLSSLGLPLKADAQTLLDLPQPGSMVQLSAPYQPALLKGLTIHPDDPFQFDFIVDIGQDKLKGDILKAEAEKQIKYFLASLAIPEKDWWVNLSPYEKDKTVPEALSQTDLGRDLLAQDYILKQITASLIYPEKELGKVFWDKVYAKAREMYGNVNIPVNTFNKVWITSDQAEVFERGQTAIVTKSHLKVMLEQDYLATHKNAARDAYSQTVSPSRHPSPRGVAGDEAIVPLTAQVKQSASQASAGNSSVTGPAFASQVIKDIVLPELEKEVNEGRNFANLRQIYQALILASWYKKNLKEALLNQTYADKSTVKGIDLDDKTVKEQIYNRYLQAYKKGVFNFVKEESVSGRVEPRKYFSGGMDAGMASRPAVTSHRENVVLPENRLVNFNVQAQISNSRDMAMALHEKTRKDEIFQVLKAWMAQPGQRLFHLGLNSDFQERIKVAADGDVVLLYAGDADDPRAVLLAFKDPQGLWNMDAVEALQGDRQGLGRGLVTQFVNGHKEDWIEAQPVRLDDVLNGQQQWVRFLKSLGFYKVDPWTYTRRPDSFPTDRAMLTSSDVDRVKALVFNAPKTRSLAKEFYLDGDVNDIAEWLLSGDLLPQKDVFRKIIYNLNAYLTTGYKKHAEEWIDVLSKKWEIPKEKLMRVLRWLRTNDIVIKNVSSESLFAFFTGFLNSSRQFPQLRESFVYNFPPDLDGEQKLMMATGNINVMTHFAAPDFVGGNAIFKAPIEGTKYFIGIQYGLAESTDGLYLALGEEKQGKDPLAGTFFRIGLDSQEDSLRVIMMQGLRGAETKINDEFPKELGLHPGVALLYVVAQLAAQGHLHFGKDGFDRKPTIFKKLMGIRPEFIPTMKNGTPSIDIMINYERFGLRQKTDFFRWQSVQYLTERLVPSRLGKQDAKSSGIQSMVNAFHRLKPIKVNYMDDDDDLRDASIYHHVEVPDPQGQLFTDEAMLVREEVDIGSNGKSKKFLRAHVLEAIRRMSLQMHSYKITKAMRYVGLSETSRGKEVFLAYYRDEEIGPIVEALFDRVDPMQKDHWGLEIQTLNTADPRLQKVVLIYNGVNIYDQRIRGEIVTFLKSLELEVATMPSQSLQVQDRTTKGKVYVSASSELIGRGIRMVYDRGEGDLRRKQVEYLIKNSFLRTVVFKEGKTQQDIMGEVRSKLKDLSGEKVVEKLAGYLFMIIFKPSLTLQEKSEIRSYARAVQFVEVRNDKKLMADVVLEVLDVRESDSDDPKDAAQITDAGVQDLAMSTPAQAERLIDNPQFNHSTVTVFEIKWIVSKALEGFSFSFKSWHSALGNSVQFRDYSYTTSDPVLIWNSFLFMIEHNPELAGRMLEDLQRQMGVGKDVSKNGSTSIWLELDNTKINRIIRSWMKTAVRVFDFELFADRVSAAAKGDVVLYYAGDLDSPRALLIAFRDKKDNSKWSIDAIEAMRGDRKLLGQGVVKRFVADHKNDHVDLIAMRIDDVANGQEKWESFLKSVGFRQNGWQFTRDQGLFHDAGGDQAQSSVSDLGGIDLQATADNTNIQKDAAVGGVRMVVDKAMIERVKREGIQSLKPVIFNITPITDIWKAI